MAVCDKDLQINHDLRVLTGRIVRRRKDEAILPDNNKGNGSISSEGSVSDSCAPISEPDKDSVRLEFKRHPNRTKHMRINSYFPFDPRN